MSYDSHRRDILKELELILAGIEDSCHPASLGVLDLRLSQICDLENEMINEDEEIGLLLDMIFERFDEKEHRNRELDEFMEKQLADLPAEEDEDEE